MERGNKLSSQVKRKIDSDKQPPDVKRYDGNAELVISTGSLLLDLAISGGRVRKGGIPAGILVEIFGPESSGKTVLLCEIAGNIQRLGGDAQFKDPEGRLNKQFALMFNFHIEDVEYDMPDTVTEVFQSVRAWEPKPKRKGAINAIFTDSLAALSTNLEMGSDEGDKMGMRRAKEFSQELRRTCRVLTRNNWLMVCSNQIRESQETTGPRVKSPGGKGIGFYSSLRLRALRSSKIKKAKSVRGKAVEEVIGVTTEFEVFKSSVWKPFRKAKVSIVFDYGIDNIRDCLQFLKDFSSNKFYSIGERKLYQSLDRSIEYVEEHGLEEEMENEVIALWNEIQHKFESERKPKKRE